MTESSPQKGSLVSANAKRHPRSLQGEGPEMGKVCGLNSPLSAFPGLFDHFIIAWEIRTTNLIFWITDFQGTSDPCCYYVLLLRPQVQKRLALLRAESY